MFQHILYPTDFSPESEAALPVLASLAERYQTRVTALHVVEPIFVGPAIGEVYAANLDVFDQAYANAERYALQQGPEILKKHLKPEIERSIRVLQGHPATEITEFAKREDVDLIVMATHGRTGFKRLLLGSVAEKTLRQAPCPVLLVPISKG